MKVKHRQRNIKFLFLLSLTRLIYYFLSLYTKTIRFQEEGLENVLECMRKQKPVVLLSWHQRIFSGFFLPRRYDVIVPIMISRSRDGEFIARIVKYAGFMPVRGSSTRGGMKALREMVHAVRKYYIAIHVVDGPTGPPCVVKAGGISLAQLTGAFLCPVFFICEKYWVFNSWDRFMIPKPFSKVFIRFGPMEKAPEELEGEEFENLRVKMEEMMIREYRDMENSPFP